MQTLFMRNKSGVNILKGPILLWNRHHTTGKVSSHMGKFSIEPYNSFSGNFLLLSITEGGVSGYESMVLAEEEVHLENLDRAFNEGFWLTCAGLPGKYDEQRVARSEMRRILERWKGMVAPQRDTCFHCHEQKEVCLVENPLTLKVSGKYRHGWYCIECFEGLNQLAGEAMEVLA